MQYLEGLEGVGNFLFNFIIVLSDFGILEILSCKVYTL